MEDKIALLEKRIQKLEKKKTSGLKKAFQIFFYPFSDLEMDNRSSMFTQFFDYTKPDDYIKENTQVEKTSPPLNNDGKETSCYISTV